MENKYKNLLKKTALTGLSAIVFTSGISGCSLINRRYYLSTETSLSEKYPADICGGVNQYACGDPHGSEGDSSKGDSEEGDSEEGGVSGGSGRGGPGQK